MTEFSAQPNFRYHRLAHTDDPVKISVMPKKRGPYLTGAKPEPKTPKQLGHYLRQWRIERGMTGEDLAEKTGLSVGTISGTETGSQKTSMPSLQLLADALGITRGMLIDVDPRKDRALWAHYLLATTAQRTAMDRAAADIVKPKKSTK